MKKRQQVYVNQENGELLILKERIIANTHDRIYIYEIPLLYKGKIRSTEIDTMLSPGKSGFKCLGAL